MDGPAIEVSAFEVFCTPEYDDTAVLMLWHGDGYGWKESRRVVRMRVGGFGGFDQRNAERTAEMWRDLHGTFVQRQTRRDLDELVAAGYHEPARF